MSEPVSFSTRERINDPEPSLQVAAGAAHLLGATEMLSDESEEWLPKKGKGPGEEDAP